MQLHNAKPQGHQILVRLDSCQSIYDKISFVKQFSFCREPKIDKKVLKLL